VDLLLKKVKLDLKLTPYRVLATGPKEGFIEYVPESETLSAILDEFPKGDPIGSYLQEHNTTSGKNEAVQNFIKSAAGYCVITYLLGIGDRHLHNIMLTKQVPGTVFFKDELCQEVPEI